MFNVSISSLNTAGTTPCTSNILTQFDCTICKNDVMDSTQHDLRYCKFDMSDILLC